MRLGRNFRRTPGGQAVYVNTLPNPLVLARPPSDNFSYHLAAHDGMNKWLDSLSRMSFTPKDQRTDGCRVSEIESQRAPYRVTSSARSLLWRRWGRQRKYLGPYRRSNMLGMRRTSSDARLRRLIARRREGRFHDCLAVKDMYRCTNKNNHL